MDFDEWMNRDYGGAFDMPHQREAYEAGQKSKQAEIDALREMVKKLIDNTVLSIDDELEDKANNLLGGNQK